jgi:hypothetical protein
VTRDFKRERGYLTFAQNGGEMDYLRMAYALALSLKATQPEEASHLSVAITPGMTVPDKYRAVFDHVIDIPWVDEARDSTWKLENEWKAYHVTPYKETVKLDADMLFLSDVSNWWSLFENDIFACTQVETYRGELVTSDYYRKTFTANNLPNVYSAFTFFRYSEMAEEFFNLSEIIFHNWQTFFHEYLEPDTRPKIVSTDVVFGLAMKLLDITGECTSTLPAPRFVHMRSQVQNWPEGIASEEWIKHVRPSLTSDLQLKLGLYRQHLPVHYHWKSFLTNEMITTFEKALGI